MSETCNLCLGSGKNHTAVQMTVNNDLCPRCGGYGTVPASSETYDSGNVPAVTDRDREYMRNNGASL